MNDVQPDERCDKCGVGIDLESGSRVDRFSNGVIELVFCGECIDHMSANRALTIKNAGLTADELGRLQDEGIAAARVALAAAVAKQRKVAP